MIKNLETIFGNPENFNKKLQRKYSFLAQKEDLFAIQRLAIQTNIAPQLSDQELSTLYISSAGHSYAYEDLQKLEDWDKKAHGGKPEVLENLDNAKLAKAVQEGYYKKIVDGSSLNKKYFEETGKLTGIAISEETVQSAINERIKRESVLGDYYFENVEKATGIKPIPDNNLVQKMYKECLKDSKKTYFWEYLAKSTKIKPEERLVQQAYKKFVREENVFDLIRFVEFLGIAPKERIVHDAYKVLVKNNKFGDKFSEIQKSTGITPKPQTVQQAYSTIVDRKDSIWDFYLKHVFEQTGIVPPQGIVQKAYEICISKGHLDKFEELYNIFRIEPSQKTKSALENFLKS